MSPSTAHVTDRSDAVRWAALVGFVVVSLAAGAVGSLATMDAVETWYPTIEKPAFTPPGWIFGPVWTGLYVLMGVAAWRVWSLAGFDGARTAMGLFGGQLALNAAWSLIFFGLQWLGVALVEIVLLLGAIVATTLAFHRHDALAAWLMLPYIAWVGFATVLNGAIWWLNL